MKAASYLACLAASTAQALILDQSPPHPDYLFQNPDPASDVSAASGFKIPTSYESAVMGRRILALSKLGHLATVFPSTANGKSQSSENDGEEVDDDDAGQLEPNGWKDKPHDLAGVPIGMMDYVADCESDDQGNPTILAIDIATTFRNVRQGSNISLSMRWTPPYPPAKRIGSVPSSSLLDRLKRLLGGDDDTTDDDGDHETPDTVPYSAANLPRFSIIGYLEDIDVEAKSDDHDPSSSSSSSSDTAKALAQCFVNKHPDAKYWLPGNRIHRSRWARLVVQGVYWVGGFGDRAYIGWLPLEEWHAVTREEWEAIRLPGEKEDWKEWRVGGDASAAWGGFEL